MESLWVFLKHQMMFCVLKFLAEILLILIRDLGSTDLTMNDSPFHVMWVVGLEVQIAACFRHIFVASLGPRFMTKTSKNGRVPLASASIVNLPVGLRLLRWWKYCCNLAGSFGQATKVSSTHLSHLVGFWSAVYSAVSSEHSINILLITGDSEFPHCLTFSSFCC
jgi:hypothetical protein